MNLAEAALVMVMVQQACPAQARQFPNDPDPKVLAAEVAAAKTLWHLTLQRYTLEEAATAVAELAGARYISPGEVRDEINRARTFRRSHDVAAVLAPITEAEAEAALDTVRRRIAAGHYRPARTARPELEAPKPVFIGFAGRDELPRDEHPAAAKAREHLRTVAPVRPQVQEDRAFVVAQALLACIDDPVEVEALLSRARMVLGADASARDVVVQAAELAREAERQAASG